MRLVQYQLTIVIFWLGLILGTLIVIAGRLA